MKIHFWYVGKTSFKYLEEGMAIYEKRLQKYGGVNSEIIPDVKNAGKLSPDQLKVKEGELILKKLNPDDYLVLLDERGKSPTSLKFADQLQDLMLQGKKKVVFLIGGAFGFSETVYKRANSKLSLSNMTFSHQMIRLFFLEQLYRAFSILNNEPYHNE
ncbi:MAG: 23S rRNA (pseudouridine(1915)-N(3))-methyltransferase RlmH [Saprospiraceae bacterium]